MGLWEHRRPCYGQPDLREEMTPFDASGDFHPVAEGGELRRLAVRGAAATVSAQALALAAQVVGTVLLARLLMPADFGVVAMVTTFSLLLMSFGTSGFSEAVIQRDEMDRFLASNLFWITCAIGLILTIGFAASGPLLARFFRNLLIAGQKAVHFIALNDSLTKATCSEAHQQQAESGRHRHPPNRRASATGPGGPCRPPGQRAPAPGLIPWLPRLERQGVVIRHLQLQGGDRRWRQMG